MTSRLTRIITGFIGLVCLAAYDYFDECIRNKND